MTLFKSSWVIKMSLFNCFSWFNSCIQLNYFTRCVPLSVCEYFRYVPPMYVPIGINELISLFTRFTDSVVTNFINLFVVFSTLWVLFGKLKTNWPLTFSHFDLWTFSCRLKYLGIYSLVYLNCNQSTNSNRKHTIRNANKVTHKAIRSDSIEIAINECLPNIFHRKINPKWVNWV